MGLIDEIKKMLVLNMFFFVIEYTVDLESIILRYRCIT